jgi:chromosome condensin MukBEF ATPase and DNA-binding subunit MukB
VNGAELVELTEAARAFGISQATLRSRLEGGAVPEAVRWENGWALPTAALAAIAEREGWPLDLTGRRPGPSEIPEQLERYISETLAAHAAVVLAKTQATAARAETEQMTRKLRSASQDLDAERAERERATAELAEIQADNAELDKKRAVAEARTDEIRQQLAHERAQRSFLAQRIGTLERERDDLHAALGWIGRRRLLRRGQQPVGATTTSGWNSGVRPAPRSQRPYA